MGRIEWAMWANEQAIVSAGAVFIGAIIGVAGQFKYWECAVAALIISIVMFWLEWPRSKRIKGNTIERRFQCYMVPIHDKLGPVTKNYYVRFVFHLVTSVPSCFLLPTLMGAMCQMIAAIIYLVAAIKKEEWRPTPLKQSSSSGGGPKTATSEPPSHPPPRAPVKRNNVDNNNGLHHESVELSVPT